MKASFKCLLAFFLLLSSFVPVLRDHTVQAAETSTINLSFTPNDSAIDPARPIIYMTKLGSKTLYAANYTTGELRTLTLPFPAERLDVNKNKLYVTQLKMSHTSYGSEPYSGAIAEVDTETFTLSNTMDINTDPFDIAVDNNGYIYIAPGSGQWDNLRVYSMKDKNEITQTTAKTTMYQKTNIFFNEENSKLYAIDTTSIPSDIEAYEINNGVINNHYDAPFHSGHGVGATGKFSPDGMSFYNSAGNVFDLAVYQSGDMTYHFSFGKSYNDFEFSQQNQLTYAASATSGIDVYQYGGNKFLYSLRKDLNVQKLQFQAGMLITINKDSKGNNFIETIPADSLPSTGLPTTPGIPDPVGTIENLGFKPNDIVIDPSKPVIYMTRLGSKTIYAANFSTGDIQALALPYPAERLELYNNHLYVTQQKMAHEYYTNTPLSGAIAEVDTETFKATKIIDVDTDPFDIAIDKDGFVYIAPGSNQWVEMKVYSLANGGEVTNSYASNIRFKSYLSYNPETSKVYSISTDTSPRDVDGYEVDKGIIKSHYDSPYHGDYPLEPFARLTPDGTSMVNNSGVVFDLAMFKSGDMSYSFTLGKAYNDYAFSLEDDKTFAARKDHGIDVYQYQTNKYLYTISKDLIVENLLFQNGKIIAVGKNDSGKYFVKTIDAATTSNEDPSGTEPSEPGSPPSTSSLELLTSEYLAWDGEDYTTANLTNGVQNVPLNNYFMFSFNQFIDLDDTKIDLTGPDGKANIESEVEEDYLYIYAGNLKGLSSYTLTIKKEAITGETGQHLDKDIVIQFSTASNWEEYNGHWYYYDPSIDDYVTGWHVISGSKYYFNSDGEMQTGWQIIAGVYYYFNDKGVMQTGFQTLNGLKFYFNEMGKMQTGWQTIEGKKYYFLNMGPVLTGWYNLDGSKYYFDNQGIMQTGWQSYNGFKYYLNENGQTQTGWQSIGGQRYYFSENGEVQIGWKTIEEKTYYFDSNGILLTGWQTIS
ncbi:hypothetical protein V7121_03020, partial [Neobacillus drentensis]